MREEQWDRAVTAFQEFLTTPFEARLRQHQTTSPKLAALKLFRDVATHVPAYKAFLTKQGISYSSIQPFDMRNALIARGYFVGDYQGLAHNQSSFLPFFVRANFNNTNDQTSVVETLKPVANSGPQETGNLAEDFNRRRLSRKKLLRSHRR